MDIEILRSIGRKLLKEIPSGKDIAGNAIGRGASGDKTYPIDKIAEDVILSVLESAGEPITIVSEEIGIKDVKGGGTIVLIDPVDGSRNAVAGIPFYCTSVAVADGNTIGNIYLAYVLNLVNRDEFWAEKGGGAFLNGERIMTQQDSILYLTAYEAQSPSSDIPFIVPLLAASRKTRCLGATALDIAYLACGSVSIFVNPSPSRSFDFAGGWLLVQEAGGVFTDTRGNPVNSIRIGLKRSTPLLVSGNEQLHGRALKLLGSHQRT